MSDCTSVEIRELLPEYLHGRLAAPDRARVDAHLAICADCVAELGTLRAVRQAFALVPPIDTAAIVRALPHPHQHAWTFGRPHVRRLVAWRLAAAISFISLGGISLVVARSFFSGESRLARVDSTMLARDTSQPVVVAQASRSGITFGGGVSDLATEDLETLIGSLESLEAAPPAEPDALPPTEVAPVVPATSDTSKE